MLALLVYSLSKEIGGQSDDRQDISRRLDSPDPANYAVRSSPHHRLRQSPTQIIISSGSLVQAVARPSTTLMATGVLTYHV